MSAYLHVKVMLHGAADCWEFPETGLESRPHGLGPRTCAMPFNCRHQHLQIPATVSQNGIEDTELCGMQAALKTYDSNYDNKLDKLEFQEFARSLVRLPVVAVWPRWLLETLLCFHRASCVCMHSCALLAYPSHKRLYALPARACCAFGGHPVAFTI